MALALLLSFLAPLPLGAAPDTVVVAPREARAALAPWVERRAAQGHRLAFVESDGATAEAIAERIRAVGREGTLRHVVLVGDAPSLGAAPEPSSGGRWLVPTFSVPAKVNVHWGSEPEIASDNPYGDLDGDGVPDVAVGRIPADNAEQFARVFAKILRFESEPGPWRRNVNVVAGTGGFGAVIDSLVESTARQMLAEGLPAAYAATMTYASWRSPFCPDPRAFSQTTIERLTEGSLFWLYMGHGHRQALDKLKTPAGAFPILQAEDAQRLQSAAASPIAVLLACYTGAFDGAKDCLAEEMVLSEGGPVAAVAASRVSMPYAMSVFGDGLLEGLFTHRAATLGELTLHGKRKLVDEAGPNSRRHTLDLLAKAISPAPQMLADERREHLSLFNLLGDPLLRLPLPEPIALTVAQTASAGARLEVRGRSPIAGRGTLELAARRDRMTFTPPPRGRFEADDLILSGYDEIYQKANDRRWASLDFDVPEGEFVVELAVPDDARGLAHVLAYIDGEGQFALGDAPVQLLRKRD